MDSQAQVELAEGEETEGVVQVIVWKRCVDQSDPEGCSEHSRKMDRKAKLKRRQRGYKYPAPPRNPNNPDERWCVGDGPSGTGGHFSTFEDFGKCATVEDGHDYRCKQCVQKANKRNNPQTNPRNSAKRSGIVDWYPELRNELLDMQGGICAICGTANTGKHIFAMDHWHKNADGSGPHRGLLCRDCNLRLSKTVDDLLSVVPRFVIVGLYKEDSWLCKARDYVSFWRWNAFVSYGLIEPAEVPPSVLVGAGFSDEWLEDNGYDPHEFHRLIRKEITGVHEQSA